MKINKKLELSIIEWNANTFEDCTLASQIDKLQEEIEEVKNSESMSEFYKELSDCYIVACALKRWSLFAYELAIFRIQALENEYNWEIPQESFEKMIADKLEINKKRKWIKNKEGVYHHE